LTFHHTELDANPSKELAALQAGAGDNGTVSTKKKGQRLAAPSTPYAAYVST